MKRMYGLVCLGLWLGSTLSVTKALATPTPVAFAPTPVPPMVYSLSPGDLLGPAEEPAITVFPFAGAQRAVVFANGNKLAVYDLVDGAFSLVLLGSAPDPEGFNLASDPVAVTQPDGTVTIGILTWHHANQLGSFVVWRSADGITWTNPIHVVDYPYENPPEPSFPDKPWMDVSRTTGRLWVIWRAIGVSTEGPYCVVTSLDGVNWSSCEKPGDGGGAPSIAVLGPDSAVAIWDRGA